MDTATLTMVIIFFVIALGVVLYYTGALQNFLPMIIVDSQTAVVVDNRLGKDRVLYEGINRYLPWIEKIEGEITLKEQPIDPDPQTIITKDNISITVDLIAMVKVTDALKAVMDVSDYQAAVKSLVQTGVVDIMGKMELKEIQTNLEGISKQLMQHVQTDSIRWGVEITQTKFESISYSDEIKKTMEKITIAESNKKAMITEAEGKKQAAQLEAEALLHKIEILQKNMPDMSNEKILEFTRSLDYINSMKNLSSSENAKFVVYPSEGGTSAQPMDQIMSTEYISQTMNKK